MLTCQKQTYLVLTYLWRQLCWPTYLIPLFWLPLRKNDRLNVIFKSCRCLTVYLIQFFSLSLNCYNGIPTFLVKAMSQNEGHANISLCIWPSTPHLTGLKSFFIDGWSTNTFFSWNWNQVFKSSFLKSAILWMNHREETCKHVSTTSSNYMLTFPSFLKSRGKSLKVKFASFR